MTLLSRIQGTYTVNELKREMKYLNAQLRKNGKDEVKRDTQIYKNPTKASFACCVSRARHQLLDVDKDFIEKRKVEIFEEHDMIRMAKEREFSKRVDAELQNSFFCFKGVKEYEEMKNDNASCLFSFRSNINAENEGIVMSDSDNEDNTQNVCVDNTRESIGGTQLFAAGGLF